ncbi:hypothetical protein TI03_00570 [Achromatium sp. WMS1]|nr:hypothetical protein TI03_00570 [Achromatium sp. WMS1]
MQFKIDIDITPEEMRRLMGLPDVQTFQQELLAQIRKQMEAGADGYDPQTLMQPFMNQATASMELFKKMFDGMTGSTYSKNKQA